MKQKIKKNMGQVGMSVWLLVAVGPFMALAQPPGGGPPPGGPFGMGPGGPPGMGTNDAIINAPIAALAYGLKLSPTQKTKIAAIQEETHRQFRTLMPRMGGGPPDMEKMQAAFGKVRQMDERNTSRIKTLLTPAQKSALPGVLKDVQTLNGADIPAELMPTLKLTATQKSSLAAIARSSQSAIRQKMQEAQQDGDFEAIRGIMQQSRQQTREKSLAALTGAQKAQVEQFLRSHPPRGPQGFGFLGEPPPGGPGGPPPE